MTIPADVFNGCCTHGFEVVSQTQTLTECSNCTGGQIITSWEITVAGITDNNCTNCTNWNGTFTLARNASLDGADAECVFESSSFSVESFIGGLFCSARTGTWRLFYRPTNSRWELSAYAQTGATSVWYPSGGFDCEVATDFDTLASSSTSCANWPSSITVTPA